MLFWYHLFEFAKVTKLRGDNQRLSADASGVVGFLDHLSRSSDIVLMSLGDIVSLSLEVGPYSRAVQIVQKGARARVGLRGSRASIYQSSKWDLTCGS
jgi:hypothetical protein